ncbi:glutathione S-transferase F13-like [Aristolochia californica]|uniref:glutathione S-transferase F13-like n=1 Tax=Aristolochia californica TaxID=171875 RepID=UPI0035DFBA04
MAPLKLHGIPLSTCTSRVLACAYEKGVDVEVVPVDLRSREHKTPEFLATKNPFGEIPVLEDGDLTLFESRAINRYIATKYEGQGTDLLREGNLKEGALVGVWLEVESQNYNPAISGLVFELVIRPMHGGSPKEEVVKTQTEKLEKVLDVYEQRLTKSKYLAGDFFSLADLHHLPYTYYLMKTPKAEVINSRPHVKAWWEDITSRPAVQKCLAGMTLI